MKLEKFREKKKINIGVLLLTLLLGITGGYFISQTFSKFTYETDEIPFINGKVKYTGSANGDVVFAFYQDGKVSDTMPDRSDGLGFDTVNSACDNEATIKWSNSDWAPTIMNLKQTKTKCTLYFDSKIKSSNELADKILLADQPEASNVEEAKEKIKTKQKPVFSKVSTTDEGLFMAYDDLGESYYFRGNVQDNWVKFADLYWRIIRINGDGTVRLIYNGKSANQKGSDTQITTSAFNSNLEEPKYVGYKWGDYNGDQKIYANGNDSDIKNYLENTWFDGALGNQTDYLADEIFCNDRTIVQHGGKTGIGTSGENYFGAYGRLVDNKAPELTCPQTNDRFAMGKKVGKIDTNGELKKPVGLITADEVIMAGGVNGSNNTSYYLYTYSYYWAMSPSASESSGNVKQFIVNTSGNPSFNYVNRSEYGVRAVINLNSNITVTRGNGSSTEPYIINGG